MYERSLSGKEKGEKEKKKEEKKKVNLEDVGKKVFPEQ